MAQVTANEGLFFWSTKRLSFFIVWMAARELDVCGGLFPEPAQSGVEELTVVIEVNLLNGKGNTSRMVRKAPFLFCRRSCLGDSII